jgi:hypothetical protein
MKCPGQDSRYWKPDAIFEAKCPECGHEVEFFKDETTRKCPACGHRFLNPGMDFGCAAYCQYAEQCIGTLPPELLAQKQDLLKDRVAIEMKRHLKRDFKRIGHAMRTARYAEEIGKAEQGNLAVILSAAYLLHMGDDAGERISAAREVLERLGADEGIVNEVCDIIGNQGGKETPGTLDSDCVLDATLIATLEDQVKATEEGGDAPGPDGSVLDRFRTEAGRKTAARVLGMEVGT